jgi:hypothetical protein
MDEIWVEQSLREEPLLSIQRTQALREAGIVPPPPPGQPMPSTSGLVDIHGAPLLPPSPYLPGPVAGGQPSIPGLTQPLVPGKPQTPGIAPGQGGRPAGMNPGRPSNQGPGSPLG